MEIATSVVGLASGVLSVGGSIYTLVGKYRDVPEFVQKLQMDCRILSSIARRLHRFAQNSTSSADMEILQEVSKELLDTLRSVERMLPEGDVGNFRSRIGALWNDADFRAKNERIRDNRANIALLLNILQVNAATGPSNGSAGNLPETTRLHDYLHGGGKEPAKISRLSMRQVTHEPEFKKLKDRARNFLSRLRRFVRDRDAKTWELHEAVANCRGDAVFKLLEAGQDANALSPDGFSPLHRAIRIASYDAAYRVVCTLVCFGATLSARDPFGDTPLSSALKLGRPLKWIMMLCEMDRDIRHGDAIPATSVRDAQGDTVLHAALRNGWIVEYLTVLLTYGASVDVPSVHPTLSPVSLAVHLNRPDLLRALLNFHAQMRIEEGLSPMQRACRNGYAEVVDVLCQHAASFDETPQPLCFAAAAGHTEVANRLLQYGCDPNGRDGDSSPLWIAVGNRHLDFARFLLNAKAEANTGDSQSPLFQSIVNKDVAMAKLLLDNGANVDVGFGEESPLYRAIDMGSQDLAVYVLQKRADINLGPQGGMPLLCAAGNNRPDLVDLMVRYGARNADFPVALFVAASSNAQDTLRQLLKFGASPHVVFGGPQTKETALGAAVSAGHVEAAEILIRGGADVNHVDKSHCDTIGYAIVHDMPEPRRV
ncbi:ankyrin repeat-containing domain protein [Plectosphaerella cucumerina]|uniref:Ankyrin repeat-containing domain protein n=1 Tax=Plectosphaerella cucumerina TaxID=40658 RepID=A0A8K0TCN4_9PEZI|nr:ankyrin repeat-containing domain protein [Plectosphaerella cucumerina]